ncbi:MAG: twin arginine-targeting protein translocase TatC, partial [Anaerolineaceae bacterium 4572_32.2]
MDELGMPLLQHLEELRQRLIRVVIAVAVGVIAGMAAAEPVLKVLIAPLEGNLPQALSPTEGPAVYFKVAVVIGVVIAMPVIMYQIFQFVAPGLESNEKRYVLVGAPVASLCFALGVAFAATVLLPAAIPFLNGFLGDIVEHRYSIDYYMSFVSNILLWAGLVFETPLVMFFLAKLGVVTPQGFAQARRIVIVGAAVGAAIITPTVDPV